MCSGSFGSRRFVEGGKLEMNRKLKVLLIILVAIPCALFAGRLKPEVERAMAYGAEAKICLKVHDDTGQPVSNASVAVVFDMLPSPHSVYGKTDTNGVFVVTGKTNGNKVRFLVGKEGYYGSQKELSYVPMNEEHDVKDGKWQPYGARQDILLKTIRNPIPMSSELVRRTSETTAINIEKAERSVLEAERKVNARELSVEKAFLNELKTLYNGKLSVYEAEQSVFSAQSSLDVLVAQGYDKNSLKYKKADMSLQSAQHKYDQAVYSYNSNLALFCNKCGIAVPEDFSVDLPDVKLANISDYSKESYSAIESADWKSYVNSLDRSTNSDFSLSSNAGVSVSSLARNNNELSATINAGVSATIKDLKASASLSVPIINSDNKPTLTLALSWSPSNKELDAVTELTNANAIKQEELTKREADSEYENTVASYNSKRDNILWEYDRNVEELKMYSEYFDEIEKWYKQGLVTRSEYLQAENSYEDAYYAVAVSKIEKMIYNIEVKALFTNN